MEICIKYGNYENSLRQQTTKRIVFMDRIKKLSLEILNKLLHDNNLNTLTKDHEKEFHALLYYSIIKNSKEYSQSVIDILQSDEMESLRNFLEKIKEDDSSIKKINITSFMMEKGKVKLICKRNNLEHVLDMTKEILLLDDLVGFDIEFSIAVTLYQYELYAITDSGDTIGYGENANCNTTFNIKCDIEKNNINIIISSLFLCSMIDKILEDLENKDLSSHDNKRSTYDAELLGEENKEKKIYDIKYLHGKENNEDFTTVKDIILSLTTQ